jgi:hypothetical protein
MLYAVIAVCCSKLQIKFLCCGCGAYGYWLMIQANQLQLATCQLTACWKHNDFVLLVIQGPVCLPKIFEVDCSHTLRVSVVSE